jgi:hypothetical protein
MNPIFGSRRSPTPSSANQGQTLSFDHLNRCDEIVITNNLNMTIKTTDDPEKIYAILDLLKTQTEGWMVPATGIPVATIRFNFFGFGTPLGNLGVDATFLALHQSGNFWSKSIEASLQKEFLAAVRLGG